MAKIEVFFDLGHYLCSTQLHNNSCDVQHHSGNGQYELELLSSAKNEEK